MMKLNADPQQWLARWLFGCLVLVTCPLLALAQSDEEILDELLPPQPVIIVNVASLDRALQDVGKLFEISGRSDMVDVLNDYLGRAGDLKGIDRSLPIGAMMFLDQSLPPRPQPVFFLPVDNLPDLLKTVELGPLKPKPVDGQDGRYEVGSGRRKMHVVLEGDYAYIARDETLFEKELPDPREYTTGLASRYDVSVALLIENVAPEMRGLITTFVRSQAEANLQQRDDEPESAYKLRRANGINMLEFLAQLIRDGRQITLGLEAGSDGSTAALELLVDAEPDSAFAEFIKNIGGKPSHFLPMLSDTAPLSLSFSWMTDEREREMLNGNIDALDAVLREQLSEDRYLAIGKLTDALHATADNGHFDAVIQFLPQQDRKFVLIGGLKLIGGESFAVALREVLDAVAGLEGIDSVDLDVNQYQSVTLHRLRGKDASNEDLRIYGGHPDLYVGAGNGVMWLGLGQDDVITELNHAVDQLLAATPGTRTAASTAPFQLIFRLLPWMSLPPRENEDPIGQELAEEAMEKGQDEFRIEVRPTENGGRVRLQFDAGFVRLLGLFLALQYDRTQL